MVWVQRPKIPHMKSNIKKFYILIIILILFSLIAPNITSLGTPTPDPVLTITTVTVTPDPVTEGNLVFINVTIQNIGPTNISAGDEILITVKIDNEQTITASLTDTLGLKKNQQRTENLTWTAALGPTQRRTLHITLSYQGNIQATTDREIRVNQRKTDLLFVTTPSISSITAPGSPITIAALITNIGKNTTQPINVSLKIDQSLKQWSIKNNGLAKGESFGVSFTWTPPVFGIYTINLSIDPKKTITEELKRNNYYEMTTSVIPWWNTSWHYRRVYNVIGTGNISVPVNFTAILHSLDIDDKAFENTSIAIVRYHSNGTMTLVTSFLFNESSAFHNHTNASGTLLWTVPRSSLYAVYFDVNENRGIRTPLPESKNLTASGSASATVISTQGWWPDFITTFETYYKLNKMLNVPVYTTAEAKNLTARFFWDGHPEFSMPLTTTNNLTWSNITQKLSKKGDWTIQVYGYDDAGYHTPSLIANFYIGQPDLLVTALSAPTVCYVNYSINITAHIKAVNTTVQHVNVSLLIDNIINQTKTNLTIQKDENRTLYFTWKPTKKGKHNVTVRIYYTDSNPGNNMKSKTVTVEGIPDLAVLNITVHPTPVDEGDPVAVTASIRNTGDGNATGYTITLYCEQNQNNHTMYYLDERNSTTINLKKNEYTNVTLTWTSTTYGKNSFRGEWAIGILISNTTQTPDKNGSNNQKALFHALWVTPAERNPPLLTNLEYPTTQEQGNLLLIRVKATDASGIDSVTLSIKQPNRSYVNVTMTAKDNDRYEYQFEPKQLGRHTFFIKATDLSPSKNQSIITGAFDITDDLTPPTITFFGVTPTVQIPGRQMEIRCLTTDYSDIQSVELTILSPDNRSEVHLMRTTPPDTKYVYTNTFDSIGRYLFSITVTDKKGNERTTQEKTFWITNDLNDTDSDGIPDDWELRYGLNPYDPTDALLDMDNDGASNLQEYRQGSNPTKESSSSEFIDRLQENGVYLVASLLVFASIVVLSVYGMRRRKP